MWWINLNNEYIREDHNPLDYNFSDKKDQPYYLKNLSGLLVSWWLVSENFNIEKQTFFFIMQMNNIQTLKIFLWNFQALFICFYIWWYCSII